MADDLGTTQRRQWLGTLSRRRRWSGWRRVADSMEAHLLPTRRRTRALLRATLVRL